MTGRRRAAVVCAALALAAGLTACSSPATSSAPTSVAPPGCHTDAATVHLALTDRQPIPVVRVLAGGCIAVSVPRSPFRRTVAGAPTVDPPSRLHLVSDSVLPDGTRRVYYTARGTGAATVSSTVRVRTAGSVPQWNGVVVVERSGPGPFPSTTAAH